MNEQIDIERAQASGGRDSTEEEPMYTDDNGVPMLFDVVMPGEHAKAAGVVLAPDQTTVRRFAPAQAQPATPDLSAQIDAAVAAALPAATEKAAAVLRANLLAEVQRRVQSTATERRD